MQSPVRWRDQRGLVVALTVCFGVMLVSSLLLAIALANRIAVVRDLRAGELANIVQRAEDADDYVSAASSLFLLVQVVITVLFIIWMFRAAKNHEALGRTNTRFGPGWAIGGWFIPIANLVLPVLIVQDLWRGGDASRPRDVATWRNARGSWLVGCWWTAWVLSLVRFSYSGAGLHDSGSLDDLEASNTVALVGVVCLAGAAVLAVLVVRALSRRQLDTLRAQRAAYDAARAL